MKGAKMGVFESWLQYYCKYKDSYLSDVWSTSTIDTWLNTGLVVTFSNIPEDGIVFLFLRAYGYHTAGGRVYLGLGTSSSNLPIRGSWVFSTVYRTYILGGLYPVTKGSSYDFRVFVFNDNAGTLYLHNSTQYTRFNGIYIRAGS